MTDVEPADPQPADVPDTHAGDGLIRASWIGTALYAVAAVATTVTAGLIGPLVAITAVLFTLGLLAFVAAYLIAVGRSREDLIGMGGLFFLAGTTAPPRVRRHLLGSLAVQLAIATVTSVIGISRFPADATNPLAFGFMASLYELSVAGLWGARHGSFAPRPPDPPRPARRRRPTADDTSSDGVASDGAAPVDEAAAGGDADEPTS